MPASTQQRVIRIGDPGNVPLASLRQVYLGKPSIQVDDSVWTRVVESSDAVLRIVASGDPAYGINTGFGLLAQCRIPDEQLGALQRNLVLSHNAGVGDYLDERVTRLILFLKITSLLQGYSGVRRELIEALLLLLHHDIAPCIPAKGSVGASGDLAPLAHLAATLLGEGNVRYRGDTVRARDALSAAGIEPIELGPKEGLALLNGTQVSTALALAGLFEAEHVFAAAVVAGAMSVDSLKGSVAPFDDRIHRLRRQHGQRQVAAVYRKLLEGSSILTDHADCGKVQDPYSLRCQPQVMGACLDSLVHAANVLEREANAVTDNPLVFADDPSTHEPEVLSGGNFHAEPVAFAADALALAIAEIGSLAERRIALLVDPHMNGDLPAFLVEDSGLNSGFMIAQVTAAALVSENKALAHPASVDSIPTSANQEDHVSMATYAARRLLSMTANAANVVSIELLAACQAIEFHKPLTTSKPLQAAFGKIRSQVPMYEVDRLVAPDIDFVSALIQSGEYYAELIGLLPTTIERSQREEQDD